MDSAKKMKIARGLLFAYLVLFPFGQLLRFGLNFGGYNIPIHLLDLVIGLFIVYFLTNRLDKPDFFKESKDFVLAGLFSLIFSIFVFQTPAAIFGGLYLLRLAGYLIFAVVVWNIAKAKKTKELLVNSLLGVTVFTALFGWIQYFLYPDFRPLVIWGWDDHLYRLIGTFLDPTFTSIILVFGFLISFIKFERERKFRQLGLSIFLLVSLAFTYSRAGYLALIAGMFGYYALKTKIKVPIIFAGLFLLVLFFLPRPSSEGVKLERLKSIYARFGNYSQTLTIIQKSPVLGVGFNNVCLARKTFLADENTTSHSCGGSDSSILFIIATTGVVGLLIFIRMVIAIIKSLEMNTYGKTFLAAASAVFIHSAFSNSLFYPWVLGYLGILIGISLRRKAD